MTAYRDPLYASTQRLRDTQRRVDHMRKLAFEVRADRTLHMRAISVLNLLEDSLFELTIAHDMLRQVARE